MQKRAPLPFIGQKRNFIQYLQPLLKKHFANKGDGWTIIDVFGGSGLLAHVSKYTLPNARVIYNDFDDYSQRLKHIDDTNRLRKILFDQLKDHSKIDKNKKEQIKQIIQSFNGFIDLPSLSSWLLFSGVQIKTIEEFYKLGWHNRVRATPYPSAKNYLDGLEITSKSYIDLIPSFQNQERVLLLLDPPYISTMQGMYKNDLYFGMIEFLKLMQIIKPPFIFFGSSRSEMLDYINWVIENKIGDWQRFSGYQKISLLSSCNISCKYEDNMIFKI